MLITQKLLKYRRLKNVVFVILLLKICLIFGQKKVVVIDVGHGGNDTGVIGINGLNEKNVVLDIAKQIIQLNKVVLHDEFDIYLTRYTDTLISLGDRNLLAKTLNADVFVSLHCNALPVVSKGIEVYVHNSDRENTKASIGLGLLILNETTEKLGFKKRGVRFANFQVIREAGKYPSVLVEMGFMTNTDEADYYEKPKNVRVMALAILMGITNYLKLEL